MFDLDGTLADTLTDLAHAGNHALAAVGRPTFPVARYNTLAGQGLDRLLQDALGPDHPHLVPPTRDAFLHHYEQHRYDHTQPFPGIAPLLDQLVARGITLAAMSNKPHAATADMIERLFAGWPFAAALGQRPGVPVKPDPQAPLEICETLGLAPEHWAYVGDTDVDMKTGRAAGFLTVGVTWGFRAEAELLAAGAHHIIHRPADLLPLLR